MPRSLFEASGLAGHELGLSQRIGQNGAALVGGEQLDRQVMRAVRTRRSLGDGVGHRVVETQ